jgi:hypothetical protein
MRLGMSAIPVLEPAALAGYYDRQTTCSSWAFETHLHGVSTDVELGQVPLHAGDQRVADHHAELSGLARPARFAG